MLIPDEVTLSRTRIQELITTGRVTRDDVAMSNPKIKINPGEVYQITLPPPVALGLEPEEMPLDIVYEDADVLVVNKPAGQVVHPGTGVYSGTLVHGVLWHCGDSLSGIGGVERPGIVHRIDKDTSGLLVIAKNDAAHQALGEQFRAHSIERVYIAFVYGALSLGNPKWRSLAGVTQKDSDIRIDRPLGRHPHNRVMMAVREDGKHAITYIRPQKTDASGSISKVECRLETGRTHQIRVHMDYLGFPLLGDPTYGHGSRQLRSAIDGDLRASVEALSGQGLHAARLGFDHPTSGERMVFDAELPTAMAAIDRAF